MSLRTTTITGLLTDSRGTPIPSAIVTATLQGATNIYSTQDGSLVDPLPNPVSTALDGTFSLSLLPPGDLSPSGLFYQIVAGIFSIRTTPFPYSATALPLSTVAASSPTPSSTTTPVYDYLIDPGGVPIANATVTCKVSENAINTGNLVSLPANQYRRTTTDVNGYYQFNLIPSTNLAPAGVYYLIYENGAPKPKSIFVGSGGGTVNSLIITPSTPGAGATAQSSIAADQIEAQTFDTLSAGSNIVANLNRIRYVLSQYVGGASWHTTTLFAQLSPLVRQLGNISITGSVSSGSMTTDGLLNVGGNATVLGNLVVDGSITGAALPNAATVPPGAFAVWTTPWGRQSLNALHNGGFL